jgi:prephenate dehydratase
MLPHQSGSLLKALSVFADRGLNLTKIQSRPLVDKPWEYSFYMDFQARREDESPDGEASWGLKALYHLSRFVPELFFLGWYPEMM